MRCAGQTGRDFTPPLPPDFEGVGVLVTRFGQSVLRTVKPPTTHKYTQITQQLQHYCNTKPTIFKQQEHGKKLNRLKSITYIFSLHNNYYMTR
jgi:hypothetical protein